MIFDDGGQKLILDDETLIANDFDNALVSFGFGDAVDFSGLAYARPERRSSYDEATGLVTVNGRNGIYSFTAVNPAETEFTAGKRRDGRHAGRPQGRRRLDQGHVEERRR